SRRQHTRFSRDWSSDVCSSDLQDAANHFSPSFQRASQSRAPPEDVCITEPLAGPSARTDSNNNGLPPYRLERSFSKTRNPRANRSEARRVGKYWRFIT